MKGYVNDGKKYGTYDPVLHSDPDCMYVTDGSTPVAETDHDPEDLDTCDYCTGRVRGEKAKRSCPFCAEEVKDLPDHLPCEASP